MYKICTKSLKDEMFGEAKWVAQLNERGEGMSFLSSVAVSVTLGHNIFWMCVSVSVCVRAGCGLSFMRDAGADVTFLPVKARPSALHTPMYVTRSSPTGNVCFLL